MTPVPAKISRLLREQVCPSLQVAADVQELDALVAWALLFQRCCQDVDVFPTALCAQPVAEPGLFFCPEHHPDDGAS